MHSHDIRAGNTSPATSPNFRDVGAWVNLISGKRYLREKRLYRGGRLNLVRNPEEIGSPKTILNLKEGNDVDHFGADYRHHPKSDNFETYETAAKPVRVWLNGVMGEFEDENLRYPVLVHCTAGKDRTGVVIASLLWIMGIPDPVIVEEYLLSEGKIKKDYILTALAGISGKRDYFNRVDLGKVKANLEREILSIVRGI